MDAFAVAVGVAMRGHVTGLRPAFRLWFHFGLFQFLMPVIGWFVGLKVAHAIGTLDHWVALGILSYVGGRMIYGGCQTEPAQEHAPDPTRGWPLMLLSVATSVDALAIGLSLAMLRVSIWYPSLVIGVVTAALSFLGVELGCRLGRRFSSRAEIIGGLILILIGVRIVAADYT